MTRGEFNQLITFLQKNDWLVYGPTEKRDWEEIAVELIENPTDLFLDGRLPFFSFKRFFVPEKEILFHYKNNNFKAPQTTNPKTAIIGINILDLNAVNLYDQVFEKDPYYQERKKNLLVIGHSFVPPIENNFFEEKYEEDVLEHLPFDIFLAIVRPSYAKASEGKFVVFSGSDKGKQILEDFGYKNYRHIQFSGPVREQGDKRMEQIRERMANRHNPSVWNKLGEICLDCGKCTIICPTCFCFRIDDEPSLEKNCGKRTRCWDSCFYEEFSEVAGGTKFLNSTAKKIHFWYYHKFVRIPDEYNILGCVGCGRCYDVCPVRINIRKILKEVS